MSKIFRRTVSLVVCLSLCVSVFAGLTVQGAFQTTVTGWPTGLDTEQYPWFGSGISEADQKATRDAMVDEIVYQNDVLNFRMGTKDDGTTTHDFKDSDDGKAWDGMLCLQMENRDASKTDNVGNPWQQEGRRWCVIDSPFIGMAFSVKGVMASQFSKYGDSALGNEFQIGDTLYQAYWFSYEFMKTNGDDKQSYGYFPGNVPDTSGQERDYLDGSNNTFRYAVAKYNQDNKRAGTNGKGLTVGYPNGYAVKTPDDKILYQTFTNPQGTAYVAINTSAIPNANLTGAYVIAGDLAARFISLGEEDDARFAITGAPISNAVSGKQQFEKGTLTASGFQNSSKEITAFSLPGEVSSAVIDQNAGTITAFLPEGTNVSSLTPTVTITGESYTPTGAQNFTNPVKYTVKAQNGETKEYTVTIKFLSETDIGSFKIGDIEGTINQDTKVITIVVPSSVDLTAVTPVITTVNAGATVTPAGPVDLSNSWTSPVKFTVTKDAQTKEYTVKARKKSADTTITSFKISKDQFKYTEDLTNDIVATIDNNAKRINITYPYGNSTSALVTPVITLAAGATISPDPAVAPRDQVDRVYTVTAEDGNTTDYTVKVAAGPVIPLPQIDSLNIEIEASAMWDRFGSATAKDNAKAQILAEYNYQRSIGYDCGDISGKLEGWGNTLIRQFFVGGMGQGSILAGNTLIGMDVADGLAYTIKNQMTHAWTRQVKDSTGKDVPAFDNAGAPVVDEFTMGGKLYQQFSRSYGIVENGQANRVVNGVGYYDADFMTAIQSTTTWFDATKGEVLGGVADDFRRAYEVANKDNHNPGIALDGNLRYNKDYDFTYQVFSGSGELHATDRNASNKTLIVSGTQEAQAIALYGVYKELYESIPGETVALTLDGVSLKYNKTYGVPVKAPLIRGNDISLDFQVGESKYHAQGTLVNGNLTDVKLLDGPSESDNNFVKSISFAGNPTMEFYNEDPDGPSSGKIVLTFDGYYMDSTLTVTSLELEDPTATANVEAGGTLDILYGSAKFIVTAEDGTARTFYITVQDDSTTDGYDPDDEDGDGIDDGTPDDGNPAGGEMALGLGGLFLVAAGGALAFAFRKKNK